MPTSFTLKSAFFALAALVAVAATGSAHAAVVPPFHGEVLGRTLVTPAYWVWRHHHKIWIPMHRHGY
jgi:hypothetical protein